MNYTLKNKYLLTFTLRDDGSSRFSKNTRWGLFPSAALGWKIIEEPFLKNVNSISDLKLRLGWGVTGQQNISNSNYSIDYYPYLATYLGSTSTAQYPFGGQFYTTQRPNPYDVNIKWEETTTQNVGLDFGFFKNRITGSLDYYIRKTNNLIGLIPVPLGTNFTNLLTTNVGNMENKGYELTLDTKIISSKDWFWEVGYNLSYNKNEITKLLKISDPNYVGVPVGFIGGGVGNTVQIYSVGYPKSSFFVYQQVYGQNGMPIEGLYVDRSGNGGNVISNLLNKYHYQKSDPDYTMGISSKLSYKKIDFSFSGRINLGNYVYNNLASNATYSGILSSTHYFSNVPRSINDTKFTNAQYFSDFYVENASFFKMDNISLGYNFAPFMQNKISMRLGLTVQNVFVITKYTGLDPEVNDGTNPGIDNNIYPRPRTYLVALSLDF